MNETTIKGTLLRAAASVPRLTIDQKAEVRVLAPLLLEGAKGASDMTKRLTMLSPSGFWQAAALGAVNGIALAGAGLAVIGAVRAFAACDDGAGAEEDDGSQLGEDFGATNGGA
jgi:hypothetical protein